MKSNKKYLTFTIFQKIGSSKEMFLDRYEKQGIIKIIKKQNVKFVRLQFTDFLATKKGDNYWIYGDRAIAKMNIGDYKGALKDFDEILELEQKEIYKEKRKECLEKINKK